jgi:hypothetical protein
MDWLVFICLLLAILACIFGGLGAWVATHKHRGTLEGFILGLLFGPLGVLVEALLPNGSETSQRTASGSQVRRNIDELGMIAYTTERLRSALEAADPDWEKLSYHKKRILLKPVEK